LRVGPEVARLVERRGYPSALVLRHPRPLIEPFTVAVVSSSIEALRVPLVADALMTFVLPKGGMPASLQIDAARMPALACDALLKRLDTFFRVFFADGSKRISDLRVMSEAEEAAIVHQCNETLVALDRSALIHRLIEAQAA